MQVISLASSIYWPVLLLWRPDTEDLYKNKEKEALRFVHCQKKLNKKNQHYCGLGKNV
jgi:hypothetical protein